LRKYQNKIEEFRGVAEDRVLSSAKNDIEELFTALDFMEYLGDHAFNKIEVVKSVAAVYSVSLIMVSMLTYTTDFAALEELLMLLADVVIISCAWYMFCMEETGYGLWTLPDVA